MHTTKELILVDAITPTQYLRQMLALYPFDIEEALVFSLVDGIGKEHPSLFTFIEFMRHVQKYHIFWKDIEKDDLHPLFETICRISQRNKMVLHTHQFQFHASLHVCNYAIHNPYGHLPLDKIAFVDRIYIHHAPTLSMPKEKSSISIEKSNTFLFKHISINANDYIALSMQMSDQHGILYIPKSQLGLVCACASLYQITKPNTHNQFIILCGITCETMTKKYYYDATNELYIGLISGQKPIHFEEIRSLLTTIYAQICIKKQDYPMQAAMLSITLFNRDIGILLCGIEKSGKSEILDALLQLCDKQAIPTHKVSDDQTTLHYLDQAIYATGFEIGAYKRSDSFSYVHLYQHLTSSVPLQTENKITHLLVPFTTFEETMNFHKIDICIYLDHQHKTCGYQSIDSLQEAKELFKILSLHEQHPVLLYSFLEWMYLAHVEVGVFTTHCTARSKDVAYMRFAKQLLAYLQTL